jgi:hypothetical protein
VQIASLTDKEIPMKSKEQKREEAQARQEKYDSLTTKQKLKRLNKGKFRAHKERMKLGDIPESF